MRSNTLVLERDQVPYYLYLGTQKAPVGSEGSAQIHLRGLTSSPDTQLCQGWCAKCMSDQDRASCSLQTVTNSKKYILRLQYVSTQPRAEAKASRADTLKICWIYFSCLRSASLSHSRRFYSYLTCKAQGRDVLWSFIAK